MYDFQLFEAGSQEPIGYWIARRDVLIPSSGWDERFNQLGLAILQAMNSGTKHTAGAWRQPCVIEHTRMCQFTCDGRIGTGRDAKCVQGCAQCTPALRTRESNIARECIALDRAPVT